MIFTPLLLTILSTSLAQYEGYEYDHGIFQATQYKEPVHYREPVQYKEPVHHEHREEYETDFHAHPKYAYDYSVRDPHTGDDKEHWEHRDGDKVKGSYTLTETDGTKRVVEYEADDKNGFNAVVHRIGTPKEPEIRKHPHYEAVRFHQEPHDFQQFDDGFVPVAGGYGH